MLMTGWPDSTADSAMWVPDSRGYPDPFRFGASQRAVTNRDGQQLLRRQDCNRWSQPFTRALRSAIVGGHDEAADVGYGDCCRLALASRSLELCKHGAL